MGSTLLRLTGILALDHHADGFQRHFTPLQFGIGVKSGAELMLHATRAHLALNPGHMLISADASNAFNSFTRSRIWE